MRIKILDVSEADMRKAENRFKNEVVVDEACDETLYNLTFVKGCTISTHEDPIEQIIVYNSSCEACLCLFIADFSEVHIV